MRGIGRSLGANRVVVALSVARLGDAVGNSLLYVVLPLYAPKLAAPAFPVSEELRVGILISLYGFANALLQPFAGALSDRLDRRKILIEGGLVVMGLSTLGFIFAARYVDLLVLRAVQGLGVGLVVPPSLALLTIASQKQTRGGSMGIYTTLRIAGFAIGPLIGGFMVERLGFSATFVTGAAFVLVGLAAVRIWVQDVRGGDGRGERRPWRIIDRESLSAGLLGLGFATLVMAIAFSLLVTLETQFNARLKEGALGFAIAFSALLVARLLLQVPVGRLSDRLGRKPFIVGGLIVLAPATALLPFSTSTLQLAGLRVFQGIGSAGVAAPAFALAGDLTKAGSRGRQVSLITVGYALGLGVGPLIAGLLAPISFLSPFLVAAFLTLAGAWVVARYVPETVQRAGRPRGKS